MSAKNEINFETELIKYVCKDGAPFRSDAIVKGLSKKYKDRIGFGISTIKRKIAKAHQEGLIAKICYDDFEKYGIKDTSKNAVYIVPKQVIEFQQRMNEYLDLLENGDDLCKKTVLEELETYPYTFSPVELDKLVDALNTENLDIIGNIIRILQQYILNQNVIPKDTNNLIAQMKRLLKIYPMDVNSTNSTRHNILSILGKCGNEIVIEQLIEDASKQTQAGTEYFLNNAYLTQHTALLIHNNFKGLFDIQMQFKRDGNEVASEFIKNIRYQVNRNMGFLNKKYTQTNIKQKKSKRKNK